MNATLADLGSEIGSSLDRQGRGAMLAPLRGVDGTVGAPAVAFSSETGSGLYRAAANDVRFAVGGVDALKLVAGGVAELDIPTTPSAVVKATGAGAQLWLQGNRTAADTFADVVVIPTVARTAGVAFQIWNGPAASPVAQLSIDYHGLLKLEQPATAIQPASLYTTVTPNAGWNTSATIAYWKTASGDVRMKGSAAFVSGANPVFTLPAGFRPAGQVNHISMFAIGGPIVAVVINPSGTVSIQNQSTGALASGAFDGISFLAEA